MRLGSNQESTIPFCMDCDALHDLVSFVQLTKREKHPWRSITSRILFHGSFLRILNCKNGTKSRSASHI